MIWFSQFVLTFSVAVCLVATIVSPACACFYLRLDPKNQLNLGKMKIHLVILLTCSEFWNIFITAGRIQRTTQRAPSAQGDSELVFQNSCSAHHMVNFWNASTFKKQFSMWHEGLLFKRGEKDRESQKFVTSCFGIRCLSRIVRTVHGPNPALNI